jgi:DNA-binding transcriptional MerR regulator
MNINASTMEEFSANIEYIKKYIDENAHYFNPADDSELISLIKANYRVTNEEIRSICEILEGRRKENQIAQKEIDKIVKNLEAYCQIVGVKMMSKGEDGSPVLDIEKLKTKLSARKSAVKKQFMEREKDNSET